MIRQIEVFVHDQREQFSSLDFFKPEHVVILNNTVTSIFIRPEIIQKQNRKEDPCRADEGHSYSRVSSS